MANASSLYVNIAALVLGMQRLNYEKGIINAVLGFLRHRIDIVATDAIDKLRYNPSRTEMIREGEIRVEVIVIKDSDDDRALKLEAFQYEGHGNTGFLVKFGNEILMSSDFHPSHRAHPTAEALPANWVGRCHALLSDFATAVCEKCPEPFKLLDVYYAAAERARADM